MCPKRASKEQFKNQLEIWESKGHRNVVTVHYAQNDMILKLPIYGIENEAIYLVVEPTIPDPVARIEPDSI